MKILICFCTLFCCTTIIICCGGSSDQLETRGHEEDTELQSSEFTLIYNLQDNYNKVESSFSLFSNVIIELDKEGEWVNIHSNGYPDHDMMVGIENWQQQLPIPQKYKDENAWKIPLKPQLSNNPISTQSNFMKGALAIAVNGVPIFNPLNNRGEDASLVGELDEWGGHSGRADDYHYHLAPLHLEAIVGPGNPIAYGLDGFPIYGSKEPDGSEVKELDEFNGHFGSDGIYHYHATDKYPYFIGALRGNVNANHFNDSENQIIPQAKTIPFRPPLEPLENAVITGFERNGELGYSLFYELNTKSFEIEVDWSELIDIHIYKRSEGIILNSDHYIPYYNDFSL